MYSQYPFKSPPQVNPYHYHQIPSPDLHINSNRPHLRGTSYDQYKNHNFSPQFNTPPKPQFLERNQNEKISDFFTEKKKLPLYNRFENEKTTKSSSKMMSEIANFMENKRSKIEYE